MKFISDFDREMSQGMRDMSRTPLTDDEIDIVKKEIHRIKADESIFIFNDPDHIATSTCYNFIYDRVFVTRNVFPDLKYGSTHPRDLMSIGAVLAHEYYGHRSFREEYIKDYKCGNGTHTVPVWQDECRASITAAKIAPNLTERDKSNLIMDAIYRAQEYNHRIELDSFMKEVLYGYSDDERNITSAFQRIVYVSEEGTQRDQTYRENNRSMSKVRNKPYDYDDPER